MEEIQELTLTNQAFVPIIAQVPVVETWVTIRPRK